MLFIIIFFSFIFFPSTQANSELLWLWPCEVVGPAGVFYSSKCARDRLRSDNLLDRNVLLPGAACHLHHQILLHLLHQKGDFFFFFYPTYIFSSGVLHSLNICVTFPLLGFQVSLIKNCRPATRPFRASSSNFFFLGVLLIGLILACVPVTVSIAQWVIRCWWPNYVLT